MTQDIKITFQGNPLGLGGQIPVQGTPAPDFKALKGDLSEVALSDFKGKKVIISVVPSLDTPVCSIQTKKFNEEAAGLGDDVVILTVSMDLPFAQARFCDAQKIDRVITVSDHRAGDFGTKYGVLIKGLRLLSRSVFVVDADGNIAYVQIVPEITQEPDYEEVLDCVKQLS